MDAPAHTPEQLAETIEGFLRTHPASTVYEAGKPMFDTRQMQWAVSTEHGRCSLQMWDAQRNIARRIVGCEARAGGLRLRAQRLGHAQPTLLELRHTPERRTRESRDAVRQRYVALLERVLARRFDDMKPLGFRAAMDLEKSFGPAYARGSLVRGQQAWAVIGCSGAESQATIDGILTPGVLWLHHCREAGAGKRVYAGLQIVVPRGCAALTLARLRWMNTGTAQWELLELDEATEELHARDADDSGNLRMELVHRPDEAVARERFAGAIAEVHALLPPAQAWRVQELLRSSAEMVFALHGLVFARAEVRFGAVGFAQHVRLSFGTGTAETELTPGNAEEIRALLADLFARRRAGAPGAARDPLYRAAPERWLESVLLRDLQPLTRHLGPAPEARRDGGSEDAGNRASEAAPAARKLIARLDTAHVYAQVGAIAGTKDRGLLDLLAVTADGRLAVIELKAADDLQFAMQGLDYWIRVRHFHREHRDAEGALTGASAFARAGYFPDVPLAAADPRLYLVAPTLHVHPATETVLRYISPAVEWELLALDEHWRERVSVVWRRSSSLRR